MSPSLADSPRRFTVRRATSGARPVDVLVDGVDVTNSIKGFNVSASAGEGGVRSEVVLFLAHGYSPPDLDLPDAEVSVVVHDNLADYLRSVDAVDLEERALARLDLTSGHGSTTRAILAQLVEDAEGASRP